MISIHSPAQDQGVIGDFRVKLPDLTMAHTAHEVLLVLPRKGWVKECHRFNFTRSLPNLGSASRQAQSGSRFRVGR
jgi:hypothetical protein